MTDLFCLITPAWPAGSAPNGIVTYTENMYLGFQEIGVNCIVLSWKKLLTAKDEHEENIIEIVKKDSISFNQKIKLFTEKLFDPRHRNKYLSATLVFETIKSLKKSSIVSLIEQPENFGNPYWTQKKLNKPVIARLHGPHFYNGSSKKEDNQADFLARVEDEKLAIIHSAGLTAPSAYILDQTRKYYNLPLNHARHIPYPICLPPDDQMWNYDDCNPHQILFVGRFDNHKGGDIVIDAFSLLFDQYPDLILKFVGPDRGFIDANQKKWSITEYINCHHPHLFHSQRIEVLGTLSHSQIRRLRQESFMTIIPSRYEVVGYTVLEAMSQGCPTIAAKVGGIPEIIEDNVSGLLFDPITSHELSKKISVLLDNRELAVSLAKQARSMIGSLFSPRYIAQQSYDYYKEVMSRYSNQ